MLCTILLIFEALSINDLPFWKVPIRMNLPIINCGVS